MQRIAVAAALWAAVPPALGAGQGGAPVSVFVTTATVEARRDEGDAAKDALKAQRDLAREARKALEKDKGN